MTKELLGSLELNRIYQMDCLDGMALLPDKSIDMILCDLPYGTTRNKWDSVIDLGALWTQYERLINDNGAIVLTAQTPFDKVLGASNIKLLKYEWIWRKSKPTGHLNAKKMPLKTHENVLVFYKKAPTYNCLDLKRVDRMVSRTNKGNYGECSKTTKQEFSGYPKSVLEFNSINTNEQLHPTQKPLDLFEYLIKTYTNENDIVLDNCMGSGTTAVAAVRTGRNFIGFERESEYVEIANKRLDNETEAK
jgi:site-specific DNA-methyltransferase (adenine-specific)